MADRFVVGDTVTLTNTFTVSGTATDPTTVSLTVTDPSGNTDTYTYAGATITKTATGIYTKNVTADEAGIWSYTWTGTGAAADVADGAFEVHATQPLSATSTDVLTHLEARHALGINANDLARTELIKAAVSAVSVMLDDVCGPIVQRAVTAERHDGGGGVVHLDQWPVTEITTLTEYQGSTAVALTEETAGTSPASGFYAERYRPGTAAYSGRVFRRSGGADRGFYPGRGNVVATYTAGRFESTTNVDERFKGAARVALENLWQQWRDSPAQVGEFVTPMTAFPRFGLPNAAKELLADELHDDDVRVG